MIKKISAIENNNVYKDFKLDIKDEPYTSKNPINKTIDTLREGPIEFVKNFDIKKVLTHLFLMSIGTVAISTIFSGLFKGMFKKENDIQTINILLKVYGKRFDMNKWFVFNSQYTETIFGNYKKVFGNLSPSIKKRMDVVYNYLNEIGYDTSGINVFWKDKK